MNSDNLKSYVVSTLMQFDPEQLRFFTRLIPFHCAALVEKLDLPEFLRLTGIHDPDELLLALRPHAHSHLRPAIAETLNQNAIHDDDTTLTTGLLHSLHVLVESFLSANPTAIQERQPVAIYHDCISTWIGPRIRARVARHRAVEAGRPLPRSVQPHESPHHKLESAADLKPVRKVTVLKAALMSRNGNKRLLYGYRYRDQLCLHDTASRTMAQQLFELNPSLTVETLLQIMDRCVELYLRP